MSVLLGGVRWPFGSAATGLDALVHGGEGFEILGRSKAGAGLVVTDVVVGFFDSRVCRGCFGCGCSRCRWGSRSGHGWLGSRCGSSRSGSSRSGSSRSGGSRFGWCHRGLCQRNGRGGDKNGSNQRVFKHVQFFQRRQKCHALSTLDRSCALTKGVCSPPSAHTSKATDWGTRTGMSSRICPMPLPSGSLRVEEGPPPPRASCITKFMASMPGR